MIKALTFDYWGTLYKSKPMPLEVRLAFISDAVKRKTGQVVEHDRLLAAVDVGRRGWNTAWLQEYRTLTAAEWLAIIFRELEVRLTDADLADLSQQVEDSIFDYWPTLVPEAREILPQLAEQYRLAIISDTGLPPGRALHHIMVQDDIARYFTTFTFSDELGSSKPHRNNFIATLKHLEAAPTEAAHVGDLLRTDVAGAKNAGMWAVQYVGVTRDTANINVEPDVVIYNHAELLSLLPDW